MRFNVGIYNQEEANKFLRKLWAEFRREFGKCAWYYSPRKRGQAKTIIFGMMDIGIPEGHLQVDICYRSKGTIETIGFNFVNQIFDKNIIKELDKKFKGIIDIAKNNVEQISIFFFEVGVSSLFQSLGYYKSEAFSTRLSQGSKFKLAIETVGYDDIDAKTECQRKILHCLDLLSVETNSSFWLDDWVNQGEQEIDEEEIFVEDFEWIDDYPIIAAKLRLSEAGKKFLDLIAKDQLSEAQELFLRACNHFHTARKYDAQVNDLLKHRSMEEVEAAVYLINLEERDERLSMAAKMGATHMEIASVLYISALEVASSIDIEESKNCPQCGQKIYNIRRRVVDMVEKYLNTQLVKDFKGYYDQRSKYLHTGELLFNYSYTGTNIPQLDPSDPTGCRVHSAIPLLNLREYTSFCLRKVLQLLVIDKSVENTTSDQEKFRN